MATFFCLASGPSMCREDAEAVRGRGKVIAVNNTVELAPFADVLYSCDPAWWRCYGERFAWFEGRRVGLAHDALPADVEGMQHRNAPGLGSDVLHTGNNSGYQAINLAFLEGATTIVLLGYDMQSAGQHWHAPHPTPLANFSSGMPELCRPKFTALARDLQGECITVINCTRDTALTCFTRQPLADFLAAQ